MSKIYLLYSVPFRIGNSRSSNPMTAWHQVNGLVNQGVRVYLYAAGCEKEIQGLYELEETLVLAGVKVPIRWLGTDRTAAWHDRIVARALKKLDNNIDIVHCWPGGSLETLKTARRLGIKTALERPNAHTRFVYDATSYECDKLGIKLPRSHFTAFNEKRLAHEESEFELADKLLCPTEWVAKTFVDLGTSGNKIARHQYGFDSSKFTLPSRDNRDTDEIFKMIFLGHGEPRKGLHYALDAWLSSKASKKGIFYICGNWIPAYREVLASKLDHPSIKELSFQNDVNSLLQKCHALVLPSISEGCGLVTYEALACGCALLVSEGACSGCEHMKNGLIHRPGDVDALRDQIDLMVSDRRLLSNLRRNGISNTYNISWEKATHSLIAAYRECLNND